MADSIKEHDANALERKINLDEACKTTTRDGDALAGLGLEPSKLQRNFNAWSIAFMAFCTSVTWEAVSASMAQGLTSGGSTSLVWGFAICAVGALLTIVCFAEYASMIPTAGGQHHYVFELAPPKYRRILSWYTGWMTMLGWVLCALAGIFATAMQIQSWAILFSEGYVYERWHTTMIVMGLTTYYTLFAIFEIKSLHYLLFLAMVLHLAGYLSTIIYLLVNVPEKNTASYVFTDATNLSGWDSSGIAWLIGLLTPAIGLVSWDSPIHMAEEMTHSAQHLPRSLLISMISTAVATFPWMIAIAFCITDVAGVLQGPVGTISFMAQLFYNVSNGSQAVTIGLTMFLPVMGLCGVGSSIVTATSRIVWSFARDGGLPQAIGTVSDRTQTPVWALGVTWLSICALSCVYVGNATAFYGLSSACAVTLLISYASPLMLNTLYGFRYCTVPRGSFTLGRWHRPVSLFGCAWSLCLIIMLCFPTVQPTTAENMNYASAVTMGGFLAATIGWFVYGRKQYVGIIRETQGVAKQATTNRVE